MRTLKEERKNAPENDTENDVRYVKTVLGGCNQKTDEDLKSRNDDSQEDEVIISTSADSIHVFVKLKYYCATPFETQCKIENNTIKMYITDVCENADCYARCYCDYTFDFQFERKGEINYNYIVELISPLEGRSKILSEGKIEGKNIPACIEAKIQEIKSQPVWNPPAQIWQYQYNGQTVYGISSNCCDQYNRLVDENCNILCSPSGGITGKGDGRCPDFFDKQTDEKLIWKDER